MVFVSQTFNTFVSPFASLLVAAKDALSKEPVPCWTEYLRECNKSQD